MSEFSDESEEYLPQNEIKISEKSKKCLNNKNKRKVKLISKSEDICDQQMTAEEDNSWQRVGL